ncbi:sulfotransferase 1A1-like [Babylonia areolata]|uniref:sulfotransferase 1A1-like n=1 Tax=Babylonia areolata TaxID=304850 RepID=UPI003FD47B86
MTTEKVKDAKGHTLTLINFRGHYLPTFPLESLQRMDTFAFRDDDILISAYPKSGTHWVWEMTRMLLEGKTDLPLVEKDDFMIEFDITDIASKPSPRILTTHVLYHQLPALRSAKCKVIYITRNPRDVGVSFYNHHVKLTEFYGYSGAWEDYFPLFLDGKVDYGSWFDYTRDWETVMKGSDGPLSTPFITLAYEDLKENPVPEASRLSRFLGQNHQEGFIRAVCEACDFAKMKQRKGAFDVTDGGSPIMYRKGEVGDWQNWFTPEQVARMEEVYQSKMAGSSFVCRYTLEKEND